MLMRKGEKKGKVDEKTLIAMDLDNLMILPIAMKLKKEITMKRK
jgi:hypothetical protein|tara:strand:- start:490 stop:621 length:132 start_codon:yes stop_codon:yes gene_type:complete